MVKNKAFILTGCKNISKEDTDLINNSNIFKLCVNNANYKGNFRIFHDANYVNRIMEKYSEQLITSYHLYSSDIEVYDRPLGKVPTSSSSYSDATQFSRVLIAKITTKNGSPVDQELYDIGDPYYT